MVKILIDSADINKIKNILKYYNIAGVTTNPTILSKIEGRLQDTLEQLKELAQEGYEIHIQTTANNSEEILFEARELKKYFGDKFFIKIPVTKEGLKAIALCKENGINTTATAIFTPLQALAAAKSGAKYVAPYVNRMENIGVEAVNSILTIKELLKNYKTEILAASFKNNVQIQSVLLSGAESVTIAPELLEQTIWHPYTDKSIVDFEKNWGNKFGTKKVVDFLK